MRINVDKANPRKLRPLGSMVICYREVIPMRGGIALPQNSPAAARWTVIAIGPDNKHDIKIGDEVLPGAQLNAQGQMINVAPIPGDKDLWIVEADALTMVIGDPEYAKAPPKNAYELAFGDDVTNG